MSASMSFTFSRKKWLHFRQWQQEERAVWCGEAMSRNWNRFGKQKRSFFVGVNRIYFSLTGGVLWISYIMIAALTNTPKDVRIPHWRLFIYFLLNNCLGWVFISTGYLSLTDSSRNPGSFNLVAPTFLRAVVITGSRVVLEKSVFYS